MASVEEIINAQRAKGPATVLANGTATPENCIRQSDFVDYYFRVTKSEHMTELKKKFICICKYIYIHALISFMPNTSMHVHHLEQYTI